MKGLQFEYLLTGTGWAVGRIRDGTSSATITASYLSDALKSLVSAVAAIAEGALEARASWTEEPGEYRWVLIRHGDTAAVEIRRFDDWNDRPDEEGDLVFASSQPVARLARAVLRAADEVLDRYGPEEYRAKWVEHEFPVDSVERLRLALRSLR